MGIRDNRMDCCPNGSENGESCGCRSAMHAARNMPMLCWFVALMVALLASGGPVFGQFTVQPMKLDLQVTSGKLLPQVLDIRNTDTTQQITINLSIVDLTQDIHGDWEIVDPNSGFDTSKLSSLKDNIRINKTSVALNPAQRTQVEVMIRVPYGSHGFSCAGIVATLVNSAAARVPVHVQYLVPVVVQVMRRAPRHQVEAVGLSMDFSPAGKRGLGTPATTILSMDIVNTGTTFPRCRPLARIWSWAGGHWRHVTTTAFQDKTNDIGIIPGAKVRVETDLLKSLPAGKYKIAGELYVDGRRTKRLDKIIDFAGDPDQKKLAVDVALDLDHREVVIDSLPGATRTTSIMVQNASNEVLNVQAVLGLPRELSSKVIGNVKGVDMDCTPWITVEPKRFTLKGEGWTQTVRITSTMPESAVNIPNYYTNLDFWSYYPDGQNAGRTRAKLVVKDIKLEAEPKADVISFTPTHISGSKYLIAAEFVNDGLTQFTPIKCKAAITTLTSNVPRISAELKSDFDLRNLFMLPAERRNFSGVLDLMLVSPGDYLLTVGLEYAQGKRVINQLGVKITTESGRRILEVTGTQEELKKVIEVKWSKTLEKAIKNNERG